MNIISENKKISRRNAEILLAVLIIMRATAYMFSKILLETMGQFTLLGIRSAIAFIILLIVCFPTLRKTRKEDVICGAVLGVVIFIVMSFELAGLTYTASVSISFEENTAVVLVPILLALFTRKIPSRKTCFGFLMSGTGIFLISFKPSGFDFNIGDVCGMMAALTYATLIILISALSSKADPIRVGIFQVGTLAFMSLLAAILIETPVLPSGGSEWFYMLYLAVICTVFGFTLQPYAQSGTTAERAGVLCALNPVTASILGSIFLNETLTLKGIVGALLILASIIL